MLIVDTGPLVALIDRRNPALHAQCSAIVKRENGLLFTTVSCLTEAMYFLRGLCGWKGQAILWEYVRQSQLVVDAQIYPELARASRLMEQYKDTPMSLADASLVALAEQRKIYRILTIDSDFHHYRINGKDSFEVINPAQP